MSSGNIVLNSAGLIEMMQSNEMIEILQEKADEIVSKCSGNYDTNSYIGQSRANVSIVTHDWRTYHMNLKNNELLKAIGGSK